ncbi:hypothetical protein [Streptomyces sp. HUAS ZL42]|uniref:hypothetical protein n=1 Tax=Streptomyces sp. HUAS ZL42 TaxID=3231715 RepID=UPI00345EE697
MLAGAALLRAPAAGGPGAQPLVAPAPVPGALRQRDQCRPRALLRRYRFKTFTAPIVGGAAMLAVAGIGYAQYLKRRVPER